MRGGEGREGGGRESCPLYMLSEALELDYLDWKPECATCWLFDLSLYLSLLIYKMGMKLSLSFRVVLRIKHLGKCCICNPVSVYVSLATHLEFYFCCFPLGCLYSITSGSCQPQFRSSLYSLGI